MKTSKPDRRLTCLSAAIVFSSLQACVHPPHQQCEVPADRELLGDIESQKGAEDVADQMLAQFDLDKNGELSRDEFAFAAIQIFFKLDRNGDLQISKEEAGPFWGARLPEVDTNKDGVISLTEVLHDQAKQFDRNDKDHNGSLSRVELIRFVNERLRAAQLDKAAVANVNR